ncbi:outer envelope protein [Pseudoduganella sp. FT55W]|uniref:Outer envelope protein n=1 Tax=Duganella rivi TaxID=2666083 RepID=A0A7X4GVD9_9BURK|nr:outer envelope protein [Duganella rivi]MYM69299.1 outer envelope protein [Duganella rivi]
MSHLVRRTAAFATLALIATCSAQAAEWSDTSLGYRYGTKFAEPFNNQDITKTIVNLSHVSGYKLGKNFFSADLLMSSEKDPSAAGSNVGAHEAYVVYRNTLDFGKITGNSYAFGPVRGVGATVGFDFNSKTDAGYNSKKRMVVAGPTLMLDVPGFLDISALVIWESNAPYSTFTKTATPRYAYKTHAMLTGAWGIPFTVGIPLQFNGYANFITAKGTNEFGGGTAPETNIDAQIMYDISETIGTPKNTFKVGVAYQYWRNKFGNPSKNNPGATARTPMVRAEYHF